MPLPPEPTLMMNGPLVIDRQASAAAYRDFHAEWDDHLAYRVNSLALLRPDLLISNIGYVSLAAAAHLSIPAIALCSLNWRDMRAAFCEENDAISTVIEEAYQSAAVFLQPRPHMPMPYLLNTRSIGPIGRKGVPRREELRAALRIGANQRIALFTLGGIPGAYELKLPEDPGIFWICINARGISNQKGAYLADQPMPFIDLLASVDAVISKEGYGTVVETICNGARLLLLTRPDWPETPYFVEWSRRNGRFRALSHSSTADEFQRVLSDLLTDEPAAPVEPTGVDEAVEAIAALIRL